LLKAIESYRRQTYRSRELLIVADGEDQRESVPLADDIRYLWLAGKSTIGHKRNVGCEAARGQVIAHWDDDDYSAPGRLADQVARLESSGKAVTGYNALRFTDGREWWEYRHRSATYAPGTTLCYRRDWWQSNKFNDREHVGEDFSFSRRAWQSGELVVADAGDLMHATIHSGNTSPRQLCGPNWSKLS